ncbi:MAG: L,D-transpeptidase [Hyphomicrobiales bacterium]|nr:L,D-transpeptidase [Hyphomicrobiales bacterium]
MNVGASRGASVAYAGKEPAGTIVIEQSRQSLYFVEGDGKAIRYNVAIGKVENQWAGISQVLAVHLQPGWTPPESMRRPGADPSAMIPSGAPNNPMGIGALTLAGGDYAIHGTNRPDTIGRAVSGGCFRMLNEDIADLMRRVRVGTRVVVNR